MYNTCATSFLFFLLYPILVTEQDGSPIISLSCTHVFVNIALAEDLFYTSQEQVGIQAICMHEVQEFLKHLVSSAQQWNNVFYVCGIIRIVHQFLCYSLIEFANQVQQLRKVPLIIPPQSSGGRVDLTADSLLRRSKWI